MKHYIKIVALAITAGGLGALSAHAQANAPLGPLPFSVFDINNDGGISPAEFEEARAKQQAAAGGMGQNQADAPTFEAYDADQNGSINADEFAASHPMNAPQGQAMQGAVPFATFDLNGDGVVSLSEFTEARANNQALSGGMGRNQANAPAFEMLDVDGNGEISQAEFTEQQALHMQQRPWMGQGNGGRNGAGNPLGNN